MNAIVNTSQQGITMTSLEIVEFINKERAAAFSKGELTKYTELSHRNFMAKVLQTLGEEGALKFKHTYINKQNGQEYPIYVFPKREATLMAMSYSAKISAAVYDRMTELEEQLKSTALALPNFSNPAEAARAWALEYEARQALEVIVQEKQEVIAIAAPKAEFYDRFISSSTVIGIRDAASNMNIHRDELRLFMMAKGWIYKSASGSIRAYAYGRDNGYVSQKFYVTGSGTEQETVFITKKGIEYIYKHIPADAYKDGKRPQ